MDNGRDAGELLELRLCVCGSTLTLPLGVHAPSVEESRIRPKSKD